MPRSQWMIFARKSRARSERVVLKKSSLLQSSMILPWSMKTMRLATCRAKPISCVTTIIVMPSCARPTITSSTSLIISGSSADVGSSNSMAIGSIASARAIATRCCWPPDNWPGNLSCCDSKPTLSRYCKPLALASSVLRPSTLIWPMVRFSRIDRWGNSSKFWNTIPMRARSFDRFVFGSLTVVLSTTICPCWIGSRPLTVLINVDLPEPDGPQMTITSPLATLVVQSVSTWNWPYHLLTLLSSIILFFLFRLANDGDAFLQAFYQERQGIAQHEIHDSDKHIHFHQAAIALRDFRGGADEIGDRQHVHERHVLEQHDGLRQQHGDHVAKGLRQHDAAHGLPVIHAQRLPGPYLAAGNRLYATAHDLAIVGRLEHDEGDQRGRKCAHFHGFVRADDPGSDVRHQEVKPEDHQHQRNRAYQVDVARCHARDEAVAGQAHHRQQCG